MLNFLGIGDCLSKHNKNTCAFMKNEDTIFMFDCGNSADRIFLNENLQGISNFYIFITHRHPDHISGLGDIIYKLYFYYNIKPVIFSIGEELKNILNLMGILDNFFQYRSLFTTISFDGFKIKFIRVKHYEIKDVTFLNGKECTNSINKDRFKCFGFKIEYNNKKIFYSGDSFDYYYPLKESENRINVGPYDYFYQDCSSVLDSPHMSYEKLREMISVENRGKVYLMHIDDNFNCDQAIKDGFKIVSLWGE